MRLVAIGAKAAAIIAERGAAARAFASLTGGWFLDLGGELVWAGRSGDVPHPRAVVLAAPWPEGKVALALDASGLTPAAVSLPRQVIGGRAALARSARELLRQLDAAEVSGGPLATALAHAVAGADAAAGRAAAAQLLGCGIGLTPAGDDVVQGALMANHLLGIAAPRDMERRRDLAAEVTALALSRTSRLGAALVADAAAGLSFAVLHRLCKALAQEPRRALAAAAAVAAIGGSSGRHLLAGLLLSLGRVPACQSAAS